MLARTLYRKCRGNFLCRNTESSCAKIRRFQDRLRRKRSGNSICHKIRLRIQKYQTMRTPQTRSSRRPKAGKTPRTRQAQTLRQTATQAKRPLSNKKRFRYPAAHPHLSTQLLRHRRRAFKPFRPPRNKSFTATAAALYDSRHDSQHTQKSFPENGACLAVRIRQASRGAKRRPRKRIAALLTA